MVRKPPPRVRKRVSVTRGSLAAPPLFGGALAGLGPAPPVLGGRTSLVGDMTGRVPPGQRTSLATAMPGPGGRASLATATPGVIGPPTGRASVLVGVKGVQLPPVVATHTTPTAGTVESESDHATLLPRVIGKTAVRGAVPLVEMSTLYAPQVDDGDSDEDDL